MSAPASPMPRPEPAHRDRLTVTLFLAGLFHLVVILGVSFAPELPGGGETPTLEVLLVRSALPESPRNDEAAYLAERTQQGSGNSASERTRQPLAGHDPVSAPGLQEGGLEAAPPEGAAGAHSRVLADRDGERIRTADAADASEARPQPRETMAGAATPYAGNDPQAALELRGPQRRELVVTPSTRSSDVAVYLDAWKRRIEQVGTLNFPSAARRSGLSGNPVIEVVLASGGGLVHAAVRRTSGHPELDRAALDILRMASPFEPFPEALAERHEVMRFAYEWQFVGGRLAGSAVEVPASD